LCAESAYELWNESKAHKINVWGCRRDLRAIRQLFTSNYSFKFRAAVRSEADPRRSQGTLPRAAATRDYIPRVLNMNPVARRLALSARRYKEVLRFQTLN
jgi:hypothetical protein